MGAAKPAGFAGPLPQMSLTDLPLVSMLKGRLQWHQARQKVLAENVANASTPGFKPRELADPGAAGAAGAAASVGLDRTSPLHLASSVRSGTDGKNGQRFETRPSGNSVNLEDEMLKVASNQSDYQLAASLYQKSLSLLRTAAGARA